jgi:hypothetical protein
MHLSARWRRCTSDDSYPLGCGTQQRAGATLGQQSPPPPRHPLCTELHEATSASLSMRLPLPTLFREHKIDL